MLKSSQYILTLAVIILGIYVRFNGLENHFATIDDLSVADIILHPDSSAAEDLRIRSNTESVFRTNIKKALANTGLSKAYSQIGSFFTVSLASTYAPAQLIFTKLLLNEKQAYREILFWGRLPSLIAGVVGLIVAFLFYKKYRKEESYFSNQLIAITLLAFSWENIIFAQQMYTYAVGVTSVLLMLLALLKFIELGSLKTQHVVFMGLFLAFIPYAQYQVLIFIPAFVATIFLHQLNTNKDSFYPLLRKGISLSATMAIPLFILWDVFINNKVGYATNGWNSVSYVFSPSGNIFENLYYTVTFLGKNTYLVIQSLLAFIPEENLIFETVSILFVGFLILGLVSYSSIKDTKKRYVGLFILLSLSTYYGLILVKKLTLSPTRHSLVLMPFFIVIIIEGFEFLFKKLLRLPQSFLNYSGAGLSIMIIISFFYYYDITKNERKDPFNEKHIEKILEQHDVDIVLSYPYTYNTLLMRSIRNNYPTFKSLPYLKTSRWINLRQVSKPIIAILSQTTPINQESFKEEVSLSNKVSNGLIDVNPDYNSYEKIYQEIIPSRTGLEFSSKIHMGRNSFYFSILKPKSD